MDRKKIKSLDLLKCSNSGLEALLDQTNSELNFKRFFQILLLGNYKDLEKEFHISPDLINTPQIKALYLLNLIVQEVPLKPQHISMRPAQEFILDALAYELIEVFKMLKTHNHSLEVNFYQYLKVLPSLVIYYSDYLLKDSYWEHRESSEALSSILKRVWDYLDNSDCWKFMNEDLNSQRHRLTALYYRRSMNKTSAEEALVKYRECFTPDLQAKIKINKLDISKNYSGHQVLENIPSIYTEISSIHSEIMTRTGIDSDSCFYYSCNDCCTKDFPTVSLLEFLYIKNWFKDHDIDMKPFIDNAMQIQKQHQEVFGEPMKIIDQTKSNFQEENPFGLQFRCPFLGAENICQVYPARPLVCRSFGVATNDGASVQACKYYLTQYQYNSSPRNERDVFNSSTTTHMFGEANEVIAKDHGLGHMKQPVGTLVAWLSQMTLE